MSDGRADAHEHEHEPADPEAPGSPPDAADPEAPAGAPSASSRGSLQVGGALVPLDNLARYLAEIRRIPVLSREEEHVLAVAWKEKGERQAAWRLVTANLRLVVMVAREYQRAVHNLLDLVQEGNVGLLEAVKQFDPYRGVRFPSYAVWWIRAYIIRYLMNNWRMVKVGTTQAQRKLFFNLQKEKDRLEAQGFSPSAKLIAQRLDVKESEVVEMQQRLGSRDASIDAPLGSEDDSNTLLDTLSTGGTAEEQMAEAEYKAKVGDRIREFGATLSGKDKVIFDARLLAEEPLTLQEIGDQYSISRERVRQIESRLKKRLKAYLLEHMQDLSDSVIDAG